MLVGVAILLLSVVELIRSFGKESSRPAMKLKAERQRKRRGKRSRPDPSS